MSWSIRISSASSPGIASAWLKWRPSGPEKEEGPQERGPRRRTHAVPSPARATDETWPIAAAVGAVPPGPSRTPAELSGQKAGSSLATLPGKPFSLGPGRPPGPCGSDEATDPPPQV